MYVVVNQLVQARLYRIIYSWFAEGALEINFTLVNYLSSVQ